MLVDTGATYCLVSPSLARRLGLPEPVRRQRVTLADGSRARLPVTSLGVRIDGREASPAALIGECDEPLLGVEALEALGLAVDPKRRRLVPTRPYAVRLGGYRR